MKGYIMNGTVTIRDIAKKAGVSVSTVSGILNNKMNFSEDTKTRVWSIANEFSYKPNQDAKKLRAGGFGVKLKTNIIMYISNTGDDTPQSNPVDRMCLSLLSWEAQQHGFLMTKYWYDGTKGFSCPPILNDLVDGVILGSPYKETIKLLQDKNIPLVLTDSPFHAGSLPAPAVNLNFRKGIQEMFRRLKECGHKSIGICHSTSILEQPVYGAIVEASATHGITIHGEFLKPKEINPMTHDKVMNDFADFAERFIRERQITAIFCANDVYALSLYDIFKGKGIGIPHDLSLIGYGRADLDLVKSPVASVAYDWPELARTAVELLKDVIDGRKISSSLEMMINPVVHYGETIGSSKVRKCVSAGVNEI
jgi:DNA-binding LacI/PurR family transcriptional regulator